MSSWKWPNGPGGGGGGGTKKVPQLQPNLYGATAMWALQLTGSAPRVISGFDRSGNGYNLSTQAVRGSQPSNIPGQARMCPGLNTGMGSSVAPPVNLGAMAATFVVNFGATATQGWMVSVGNVPASVAGNGNVTFCLQLFGTVLRYFHQNGSAGTAVFDDFGAAPDDGLDHFLAVLRAPNGVDVSVGLDGVWVDKTMSLPPSLGSIGTPQIGSLAGDTVSFKFPGGLQDVCLWPTLTKAQSEVLRGYAMGV